MTRWEKIVDGYGLQRVPKELTRELVCSWCLRSFRVLWTDQNVSYGTLKKLKACYNRLFDRCWCRHHAEEYFK